MYGVARDFDRAKGYGFIDTQLGIVFCHYSAIVGVGRNRHLLAGQEVELSVDEDGRGGYRAVEVRVVGLNDLTICMKNFGPGDPDAKP